MENNNMKRVTLYRTREPFEYLQRVQTYIVYKPLLEPLKDLFEGLTHS